MQINFLSIVAVSVAGLTIAALCGACAEEPEIVHRATGTFSYWPNSDAEVLELSDTTECTSGVKVEEEDSVYGFSVRCPGRFTVETLLPREPEDVAALPTGGEFEQFPALVSYYWTDEGRGYSPNWSEAWMERCHLTNLDATGELLLREVTGDPVYERYAAIAGTLRFETPEGCLSGEVDFEINFRAD